MSKYTMTDLKHVLMLHGFDTDIKKFELDDNLLECMRDLSEIDIEKFDGEELACVSKLKMKSNAKRFMNEKFKLHKVGYLSNHTLKRVLMDKRIVTVDDLAEIYNSSAIFVDPFWMPVEFTLKSIFGGSLVAQTIIPENEQLLEEILPKLNLYYTHITLPVTVTEVTPTSYVHEIAHSQVEHQKGIIKDYYNEEVLSIFLELLHALETNRKVFKIDLINRIEHLLCNFYSMYIFNSGGKVPDVEDYNEYDYFTNAQYSVSILKALQLLQLYDTSNDKFKDYILRGIQKVFNGEITLEEYLESVDVHYVGAVDSRYAKHFIKKIQ